MRRAGLIIFDMATVIFVSGTLQCFSFMARRLCRVVTIEEKVMPVYAAIAERGIRIEIQHEPTVEPVVIESFSISVNDGGADYKKSDVIAVAARGFAEVVEIAGLGNKVKHLMGSIVFAGQEEDPVHFNLSDLTDELQECEIDGGGPVGVNSICGAAGVCRPRPA